MTFEQLILEHDQIDELSMRLEGCCSSGPADPALVVATRSELKSVLDHHLAHEDGQIYPGLMRAGGESAAAVTRFTEQFAQLRADWDDYLADWDAECLAADWDSFCHETHALMARMWARTQQETDLIYPLALRKGVVSLRS